MTKILTSSTGDNSYIHSCYPPTTAQQGQVWWDSGLRSLVVYDGNTWQTINTVSNVSLTQETEDAIEYALRKMKEETKVKELADKYPMVSNALLELETILKLHNNLDND